MLRLTDLREILRYVPRFRDKAFVIAMDGAIVEDENFGNLLLDIALLRSLRIAVAWCTGPGSRSADWRSKRVESPPTSTAPA